MGEVTLGPPELPNTHNLAPPRGGRSSSLPPEILDKARAFWLSSLSSTVEGRSYDTVADASVASPALGMFASKPNTVNPGDRLWLVTLPTGEIELIIAANYSSIEGRLVFFGADGQEINRDYLEDDVIDLREVPLSD